MTSWIPVASTTRCARPTSRPRSMQVGSTMVFTPWSITALKPSTARSNSPCSSYRWGNVARAPSDVERMCSWASVRPSCSSSTGPETVSIVAMGALLSGGRAGRRRSYALLADLVHPPASADPDEAPGLSRAPLLDPRGRGVPGDRERRDVEVRLAPARLDIVDEGDARPARTPRDERRPALGEQLVAHACAVVVAQPRLDVVHDPRHLLALAAEALRVAAIEGPGGGEHDHDRDQPQPHAPEHDPRRGEPEPALPAARSPDLAAAHQPEDDRQQRSAEDPEHERGDRPAVGARLLPRERRRGHGHVDVPRPLPPVPIAPHRPPPGVRVPARRGRRWRRVAGHQAGEYPAVRDGPGRGAVATPPPGACRRPRRTHGECRGARAARSPTTCRRLP